MSHTFCDGTFSFFFSFFFLFFLAMSRGMWDLSFRPGIEHVEAWSLKHWTTEQVPVMVYFKRSSYMTYIL